MNSNNKGNNKVIILSLLLLISMFSLPALAFVQSQQTPYFKITLIVPGPNPSRKAWAEVIENSLDAAGIDAERVLLDWDTVYSRALTPNGSTVGKTYAEGGFDTLFVGFAMGIDPDTFPLYDSSQFPPAGQNYNLWNNSENDRLGRLIKETTDEATRLQYIKEWQQLARTEQPSATILYTQEVVAFDPTALKAEPFKVYHYPVWPAVEKWQLNPSANQTKIVLAQTGPAPEEGLNPWLTTSYYDLTVWGAIFDGLTERNDTVGKAMVPALATSWSVAADQKTWTVNLRHDVTWHDGVKFNATDVKFSYESAMADDLASPVGAFVKEIIGVPDNIKIIDEYTVEFDLPKPYAYFVSSILAKTGYGMMIPWHVLKNIPLGDWKTHAFNTASGSYTVNTDNGTYTAYGPIGTGPYIYGAYDPSTFTNIMTKNSNYWNKAALESAGAFGVTSYYVQLIEESDPAISALKSGDVDVLDSQYHLETKISSIASPWGSWVSYDAFGVQEFGFNMQHPIFGTGVATPLGQQNASRAAEAARYVRQAISHLIPRQQIIDTITGGYGNPGVTTPITTVTAGYDTSLTPYSYDIQEAKNLLALAGYGVVNTPTPGPTATPTPSFLDQYGLYIAIVVIVVIVVVVAAALLMKRKK